MCICLWALDLSAGNHLCAYSGICTKGWERVKEKDRKDTKGANDGAGQRQGRATDGLGPINGATRGRGARGGQEGEAREAGLDG